MLLPEPYEFVDVDAGHAFQITVTHYLDGSVVIHPRNPSARQIRIMMDQRQMPAPPVPGEPISIEVPALRLYGRRLDEPSAAPYWDVSSKTLRADLLARFTSGLLLPATLTLTANGVRPRKRYSVEVTA